MARGQISRRRVAPGVALALALAGAAMLATPAVASVASGTMGSAGAKRSAKTTTTHSTGPKLSQSGRVAFWECSGKTTELLVAVNTLSLRPGATLDVSFTVKNAGSASCNYTAPAAAAASGPASTTLEAGPCGSIGFEITDSSHHDVWPGTQVVHCPALGFAELAPGATVSGTGSWNQAKPNSAARVPAGNYTLVVSNKHFSFPLRIVKS